MTLLNRHKYRAWTNGRMLYFSVLDVPKLDDDAVLMQCTGLYDRYHRLIYEKDVVLRRRDYGSSRRPKRLPEFVYTSAVVEWSDQLQFAPNHPDGHYVDQNGFMVDGEQSGEWLTTTGSGQFADAERKKLTPDDAADWYRVCTGWHVCEVIGNVFETPHLAHGYQLPDHATLVARAACSDGYYD